MGWGALTRAVVHARRGGTRWRGRAHPRAREGGRGPVEIVCSWKDAQRREDAGARGRELPRSRDAGWGPPATSSRAAGTQETVGGSEANEVSGVPRAPTSSRLVMAMENYAKRASTAAWTRSKVKVESTRSNLAAMRSLQRLPIEPSWVWCSSP